MNFEESRQLRTFREEVRRFLDEHLTEEVHKRVHESGSGHDWAFYRALGQRGWIGMNWPTPEGGVNPAARDPLESAVFFEEAHAAWAPLYGLNTTSGAAIALQRCGTADLREEVMPRVLAGEIIIALGFSEPDSGSDVAAARTRAEPVPGGWLINGQKVFTSVAEEAAYIFLVTRTSTGPSKHEGLTLFLVPTDSPGIEIQPLYTVAERTNVTYYRDVFVADELRVGEVDGGWNVLKVALTSERGGKGFHGHLVRLVRDVLQVLPEDGGLHGEETLADALLEDLGRAAVEAEIARLLDFRTAAIASRGGLPTLEGSMAKLYGTESLTRFCERFMTHLGGPALVPPGEPGALANGLIEYMHRFAIPTTVYGGVSEVQRSMIAERRLRLPRTRS